MVSSRFAWAWGGLASAVALFINVVFFCTTKKKAFFSARGKDYQVNSSHDGEQEALLSDVGAQPARSDLETSQAAAHETNGASAAAENNHSIGTLAVPDKPQPQQLAVSPSSQEHLVTTAAVPDSPTAAGGTDFLQGLIEKELGPPKFAVAKEPGAKPASHVPSPSLEALLDQEFGPPKFAVPKASTWGQAPIATSKDHKTGVPAGTDSAKPTPAAPHHLRLEVVAGPSIGNVFDTVDQAMEVRIGRLPDCSLALTEDHEVSSKHATIHYSLADNCWKLIDVGSLNGSSLNGLALSANRQPSSPTPLASGDVVLLGSVTRVVVTCTPSQARAPVAAVAMPAPGQLPPIHTVAMVGPTAGGTRGSDPGFALPHGRETLESGPGSGAGSRAGTVGMTAHMLSVVGPPLAVRHSEQLGISMAVQQRLGTDHKRTNTGCEDVALWELPWCERSTSALLAIFDGHQGVRAASRAKEVLPQLLREKLKAFEAAGESSHMVHGRSASAQASLLKALFLETDAAIALDEGCTATVFLMERDAQGACLIQSANVGDSSAVLVQLPASSASPAVPAAQPPLPSPGSSSPSHAAATTTTTTAAPPPLSHAPTRRRGRTSLDSLLPTVHSPQPSPRDDNHHNQQHQQGTGASHLAALPETDGSSAEASGNGATAAAQAVQGSAGRYTPPAGTEGGALEGGGHWVKLSEDHRISSSAKERERLAGLGHKTVRTRLYGLNISRMLGDKFLKDEALGFIAEPHVSPCLRVIPGTGHAEVWQRPQQPAEQQQQQQPSGAEAEDEDASGGPRGATPASGERGHPQGSGADGHTYVILASDGLWDVLGEARAGSLIARTMAQDPGTSVTELAGLLLSQAVALRSKDDITVMVAELHPKGPTDR